MRGLRLEIVDVLVGDIHGAFARGMAGAVQRHGGERLRE